MDRNKVIDSIKNSPGVEDIEEIQYKPDLLVLNFSYVFDDDELNSAVNFANTESGGEEKNDAWYDEHYTPYLMDIALDEVSDTIQDIVEEMDLNVEYVNYEIERDDKFCEFIAVFSDKDVKFDIDEVLDSIETCTE